MLRMFPLLMAPCTGWQVAAFRHIPKNEPEEIRALQLPTFVMSSYSCPREMTAEDDISLVNRALPILPAGAATPAGADFVIGSVHLHEG
jgi:hypothetical protein